MQPCSPAAPYKYNPAGTSGGWWCYDSSNNNNSSAAAPSPNFFVLSAVYAAGPVPIYPSGAPAAAGQPILVVERTFTPNLSDELTISPGERVRVVTIYNDGWCFVRKLGADAEEGVVPYECLGNPDDHAQEGQGRVPQPTTIS